MTFPLTMLNDEQILAARGPKAVVDVRRPYAFFVEPEHSSAGRLEDVATIFLTNRECPFRCLMCDLWRHTTDERVPVGAIPDQIDYALERLPPAVQVKLYNSGNFFDRQAVPAEDYRAICDRVRRFDRVIVENHPALCGDRCREFYDLLGREFEIAMGLETVHEETLRRLNKRMTADDFARAANRLVRDGIHVRAFILLKPPFMTDKEGIEWALRSIEFAFDCGVEVCSISPTRGGNGIMEQLAAIGSFRPPVLASLESVVDAALALRRGRVFADLWDANKMGTCPHCTATRIDRLRRINWTQQAQPLVACAACS